MNDGIAIEPEWLSEELAGLVKPELQPGERLLWASTAQPNKAAEGAGHRVRPTLFALASIGMGAGAFHLIFGPLRSKFLSVEGLLIGIGVISSVAGLIALIVAAYAVADRWAVHDRFAASTYALTDRRAIIWVPQKNPKAVEVHAMARGSVKSIHRIEFPDGSGSVRFGPFTPRDDYYFGPTGFENIPNVRFVEDLTRRTLIDSRASTTT